MIREDIPVGTRIRFYKSIGDFYLQESEGVLIGHDDTLYVRYYCIEEDNGDIVKNAGFHGFTVIDEEKQIKIKRRIK